MFKVKSEALSKIGALKQEVINLQVNLVKIERKSAYVSEEKFEYFKVDLDFLLNAMGESLETCELLVKRTIGLYEDGFIDSYEGYIEEDLREEIERFSKRQREFNSTLKKAIK